VHEILTSSVVAVKRSLSISCKPTATCANGGSSSANTGDTCVQLEVSVHQFTATLRIYKHSTAYLDAVVLLHNNMAA
jgi:hypothetical protein